MFTGHPFMLEHCTYFRSELKKNSRKKRTRVEDCGRLWNGPRSKTEKIVNLLSYFVILFY